tara:strand:+ start:713 stop:1681 length:969 start_codon:yes stop_codon:yes gene_type:complete
MKKIKIFCTLGPSSLSKKFLKFAQSQKVDLVRLNMSHLNLRNLEKNIKYIKRHSNLKICIDTEGAQIRTKINKKISLKKNQKLRLFKSKKFHLYPIDVYDKIKKNDVLELGFDGLIIKIISKNKNHLDSICLNGGKLEANKGVHLVNRKIKLNYLTVKDFNAIKLAKKYNINHYALSFTNTLEDVEKFNELLPKKMKIFKIETEEALKNFSQIQRKGNYFLLDRGDLSKDISVERIPFAQRNIFKKKLKTNEVFIATNLLESMIDKPYPTRAEANDIYNSIEMGASGLVLAAETAIGKFPEECIIFLKRVANQFKKDNSSLP